ncbi:MAG TPA: hypothetical protein VGK67_39630 [Myxococcales bacterium]|jgi:hypothetical protein
MSQTLDVLLLMALPASGKSEVRKYFGSLTPEQLKSDFHIGTNAQLDDYPYVHLMRSISEALVEMKQDGIFFDAGDQPMKQPLDWGTLIHLINDDFEDLIAYRKIEAKDPVEWALIRFDAARQKVGAPPAFSSMNPEVKAKLKDKIAKECADLLKGKNAGIPDTLEGKTVVIEFARGGKADSKYPLPAPYGYQYALAQLSPELLRRSSILYVWVTPEESRRKNIARANPTKQATTGTHLSLFHGVPMAVMMNEYGCDDVEYLMKQSDKPDTVKVVSHGKTWKLPIGRFDNRKDLTTFAREPVASWKKEDVESLAAGMREAFNAIIKAQANRA